MIDRPVQQQSIQCLYCIVTLNTFLDCDKSTSQLLRIVCVKTEEVKERERERIPTS